MLIENSTGQIRSKTSDSIGWQWRALLLLTLLIFSLLAFEPDADYSFKSKNAPVEASSVRDLI
ncbi:MAG TPA: hypothetical protein PKD05_25075 [Candidatus Melainabacteria bacterium]|nr:hypothetical protein [Candidatus Melainabacteria bacterium]HMP54848.1 hypothetical protein [Candidatus Melainabacteria bacterium]